MYELQKAAECGLDDRCRVTVPVAHFPPPACISADWNCWVCSHWWFSVPFSREGTAQFVIVRACGLQNGRFHFGSWSQWSLISRDKGAWCVLLCLSGDLISPLSIKHKAVNHSSRTGLMQKQLIPCSLSAMASKSPTLWPNLKKNKNRTTVWLYSCKVYQIFH